MPATATDPWGNANLEGNIENTLGQYMEGGPGSSPMLDAATAAFQKQMLPMLQNQMTLAGVAESPLAVESYGNVLAGQLVPLIQNDMQNQLAAANQAAALAAQQGQRGYQGAQLAQEGSLAREGMASQERMSGQQLASQERIAGQQVGLQRELGLGDLDLRRDLGMGQLDVSRKQMELQAAVAAGQMSAAEADRQMNAYLQMGNMMLGLTNPYSQAAGAQAGQQQTSLTGYSQAGQLQQNTAQQVLDALRMEMLRLQGMSEAGSTGLFGGSVLPPSLGQSSATSGSTGK